MPLCIGLHSVCALSNGCLSIYFNTDVLLVMESPGEELQIFVRKSVAILSCCITVVRIEHKCEHLLCARMAGTRRWKWAFHASVYYSTRTGCG